MSQRHEQYRKIRDGELSVDVLDYDGLVAFGKWCEENQNGTEPTPEKPTDKTVFRFESGHDLMNEVIQPPKWFVPNLIPQGLTLLSGPSKIGKSLMALNMAIAIAEGGVALQEIGILEPRKVAYLALEDPKDIIKERLEVMCPEGVPDNFMYKTDFGGLNFGEKGLEVLEECIEAQGIEFLIVDTWARVRPQALSNKGSSYDIDMDIIPPIQKIAHRREMGIMLVTHNNKGFDADNPTNAVQGSMGVQGSSDSILVLRRSQHATIMHITGKRLVTTDYAVNLEGLLWRIEGNADEFNLHMEQREIIGYLRDAGEKGLRQKALIELTRRDQGNVSRSLMAMLEKGVIKRHGKQGAYYVP